MLPFQMLHTMHKLDEQGQRALFWLVVPCRELNMFEPMCEYRKTATKAFCSGLDVLITERYKVLESWPPSRWLANCTRSLKESSMPLPFSLKRPRLRRDLPNSLKTVMSLSGTRCKETFSHAPYRDVGRHRSRFYRSHKMHYKRSNFWPAV